MTKTPQPHPEAVLAMLDTGDWALTRHTADAAMTDEYNARNAWSVSRQAAPFCDEQGLRYWSGPTAYAALMAGHHSLGLAEPQVA